MNSDANKCKPEDYVHGNHILEAVAPFNAMEAVAPFYVMEAVAPFSMNSS